MTRTLETTEMRTSALPERPSEDYRDVLNIGLEMVGVSPQTFVFLLRQGILPQVLADRFPKELNESLYNESVSSVVERRSDILVMNPRGKHRLLVELKRVLNRLSQHKSRLWYEKKEEIIQERLSHPINMFLIRIAALIDNIDIEFAREMQGHAVADGVSQTEIEDELGKKSEIADLTLAIEILVECLNKENYSYAFVRSYLEIIMEAYPSVGASQFLVTSLIKAFHKQTLQPAVIFPSLS